MYDAYSYGGVIPFFCNELPEEMKLIIDYHNGTQLKDDEPNKITNWLNNVIEIDRRCKLIVEIFDNKKLVFRKYF